MSHGKDVPKSEEHRRKISAANKGKSKSEEHRHKLALALSLPKGSTRTHKGYVEIKVSERDVSPPVWMPEHRYVMEQHLGRSIAVTEHVHHINGDRTDNRIENLVVLTRGVHSSQHITERWANGGIVIPPFTEEHRARIGAATRLRAPETFAHGEDAARSKLTEEQVSEIRQRYAAGGIAQQQLAAEYGVSQSAIGSIVRGETWKHLAIP